MIAAFFDVDGTLTRTTILDPLLWYQRAHLSRPRFMLWAACLLLQVPYYLLIDRRSRARFNAVFYRRYAGLSATALPAWHRQAFAQTLQRTIFPAALACLRDHQKQGHRVVLVTGALDFVMRPLAEFVQADDLVALQLREHAGAFTGELLGPPIAEEHKAALIREYAQRHGIDLGQSFAYGNSVGDVPMLECVGHPVAVNPDRRLRRLAAQRGWRVVAWTLR
ncbi:MAG TPA: HAD family hydrolase [Gemmataceae bacterium]|jgi:HAD superfamily hydrolase (TIGR01490 family)|nr:HAD family hydrolase [Gemmataceae bacterium]